MRSVLIGFATILMAYFCVTQLHAVIDFAIFSAVWSDPEGIKGKPVGRLSKGSIAVWVARCMLAIRLGKTEVFIIWFLSIRTYMESEPSFSAWFNWPDICSD